MKLYYSPAACSLAVHIALREAGIDAQLVQVDLATHKTDIGDDYRAVNPRGYVPLLEWDDGSRHTEVAALLQYVGDLAPSSGLMPAHRSAQRQETLEWLTFVSSELHKVFSPWLWHKDTAPSTRQACHDRLAARLAELDRHFTDRKYLTGDSFTAADAYCFTIVRWAPLLGLTLNPYPQLKAYLARIEKRPAVHAALVAEGLVKA